MGRHYSHLSLDERRRIAKWLEAKMPSALDLAAADLLAATNRCGWIRPAGVQASVAVGIHEPVGLTYIRRASDIA